MDEDARESAEPKRYATFGSLMIVYEIRGLVNEYQGLLPYNDNVWDKGLLDFDGNEKTEWRPLKMKLDNAKGKKPDIFFASGLVVIPSWRSEILKPILTRSGEFLPVHWKKETGFLYNLTRRGDFINKSDSSWHEDEDGPFMIDKPAFRKQKIPKTVLFSTSEVPEMFGVGDAANSPIAKLKKLGLKGVSYLPIWDSKQGLLEYDS